VESVANFESSKGKLTFGFKDIPDYEKAAKTKESPLDSIVKKFERHGYTVEQAFNLFDDNGDNLLTLKEITDGIRDQGIDVLDSEV